MGIYFTEKNGITAIKFKELDETGLVDHWYTTRIGGVSSGAYASMNPGITTKDELQNIMENRRLLKEAFKINPRETLNLVHGDKVLRIEELAPEGEVPEADAAITNVPGLPLVIFYADCAGVYIVDRAKKAIGLAHAGWRGTAASIALKTVNAMRKEFGTNPKDCTAVIAPSIGPCCFEIGEDAAEIFFESFSREYSEQHRKELKESISKINKGKYKANLWKINEIQLICAGIRPESISAANLCTFCREDLFYSYRRDNKITGRMGAAIVLRT